MELTNLMQCIAQTFGVATGEAIKAEIAKVLTLESLDIAGVSAKIKVIQDLLDADPNTPEFDIAQNLITTLTGLTSRIAALEGDTRIAAAQAAITALQTGLAAEVARAVAVEQALAAQIAATNQTVAGLAGQIAAITAATPACDCAAITASIASINTTIGNMQGTDAAQAAQILALQVAVEGLTTGLAAANAAAASAANAAALAQAAAAANGSALATLQGVVANLSTREQDHHDDHETKLGGKVSRAEVAAIDCSALGAAFAAAIQLGLNPNGY
jgi:hypothetical protein